MQTSVSDFVKSTCIMWVGCHIIYTILCVHKIGYFNMFTCMPVFQSKILNYSCAFSFFPNRSSCVCLIYYSTMRNWTTHIWTWMSKTSKLTILIWWVPTITPMSLPPVRLHMNMTTGGYGILRLKTVIIWALMLTISCWVWRILLELNDGHYYSPE